jgi:hypothetical protein
LTLPHVARIAWALIVPGLLLVLGGIAAIVFAVRRPAPHRVDTVQV